MKRHTKGIESLKRRYGRLFVLHWEIGLVLFFFIPIISSVWYSFSEIKIDAGGVSTQFVGLKFYKYMLFEDANYIKNLGSAFFQLSYSLPVIVSLSLILAVVLNQKFKGRIIARAVFFLPVIIATGVVMNLMRSDSINVPLFTSIAGDGKSSLGMIDFNEILYGLQMPDSINRIFTSFFGSVFNLIWGCGIQTVLFIAGLQTIPPPLYEVAKVEGANPWEEFWFIAFPMLSRVTMLVVVFTMIEMFVSVDNPVMRQAYAVLQEQQIYDRSSAMLWFYFVVDGILMALVLGAYWRFCIKRWE